MNEGLDMKTFTLSAKDVITNYSYERNKVSLSFDAEISEVAELLEVNDVIENFDNDDLLEAIGSEKAKAYFGLVDEDA